jgi:GTP-binding protein
MFVDQVKIKVRGGKGGNGCVSFRREKFIPKGGPDGGDGGNGGSVVLKATRGEQSLVDLYYLSHYEGKSGVSGMGKGRHGHNGEDVVVKVPVGTVVHELPSGDLLVDLAGDGQEFVAAKGGSGGHGNKRFVTSTNRAPRMAGEGYAGEERELLLELKTIADVGLVGYPNAGKSTLLTAVSDAHPKTAPYPFTTRHPNVGVVEFEDYSRMTIADIPGLIDGAHDNVGLGHDFLRHIERCRVLLYVLDAAGVDTRKPEDDLGHLREELRLYDPALADKPSLVVANKMDLPEAEANVERIREAWPGDEIIEISALKENHTLELLRRLREICGTRC